MYVISGFSAIFRLFFDVLNLKLFGSLVAISVGAYLLMHLLRLGGVRV